MTPPHEKLAARLEREGVLPQHWRSAFHRVQRHCFLPDRITPRDGTTVDRARDEARWFELAYDDVPVVTQLDDGTGGGPGYPTSSASQPTVVADMLRRLDVTPGMRVLEIGTGTGYNAALLSHLLGDEEVTTVEVDPALAERARERLLCAGFGPLVITGDGTQGWPARAPFDRVISTAAVKRVPYHWIAQTRPGGKILTPWGNAFHNGVLATLRVGPDGTAHGRFDGKVGFMWVRGQRTPGQVVEAYARPEDQKSTVTRTTLHPDEPINDFDAGFAIGLRMPTVLNRVEFAGEEEGGTGTAGAAGSAGAEQRFTVYLVDPETVSWASWHIDPREQENGYEVRQHGPRSLFTELEAAYRWWQDAGRPDHTRFGLTVSAGAQCVWLDDQQNRV